MQILLIGLNHRTAPVELRERVAFTAEQARRAAVELRAQGVLEEAVVLSTCNRSEVYGVPPEIGSDVAAAIEGYLTAFHRLPPAELDGCLYRHHDSFAVRHLFRVAAGLDSMLLGEAEILGQVREAYRLAFENEATGPVLNRLFQSALEAGKRVRAETEIGTRPVSVAFAGIKLAERIFGNLRDHQAVIVGAGEMGQQLAEQMRNRGIARLQVVNRSRERAEELARSVGGEAVEWEALAHVLAAPDIVVTSVSGTERVLTRSAVEQAMAARGNRALFLIDLGVPRNVEASVAELYNVYLYNIDDLSSIVEQNKKAREQEVPRAEAILDEQVAKFEAWQAGLQVAAVLEQLRGKLHSERRRFLDQRLAGMQLSPEERERALRLTEELLDELLKEPASRLHSARKLGKKLQAIEALRELFGLTRGEP